jgi:hypothetical protein
VRLGAKKIRLRRLGITHVAAIEIVMSVECPGERLDVAIYAKSRLLINLLAIRSWFLAVQMRFPHSLTCQ